MLPLPKSLKVKGGALTKTLEGLRKKDILDGRHPPTLNAARLLRDSRLPLDWDEQRAALGFN